ncbi:hypothetical protein ES707_19887 [subsurface metagenome]
MKKKMLLIPLALLLIASLIACAAPAPAPAPAPATVTAPAPAPATVTAPAPAPATVTAPAPTVTVTPAPAPVKVSWRLPTFEGAPDYWTVVAQREFCEAVTERTNGNFTITQNMKGELGIGGAEFPSALKAGVIELAHISPGYISGVMPFMGLDGQPLLMTTLDQYIDVSKGIWSIVEREWAAWGMAPLPGSFFAQTFVSLGTTEPVADLADLNGFKVRCWNEATSRVIDTLGGVPVTMGITEVYLSMERGIAKGALTSHPGFYDYSLHQFVKYMYTIGLGPATGYIAYNIEAYEALPKEYQDILLDESAKFGQRLYDRQPGADIGAVQSLKDAGVEFVQPSAEKMIEVKGKLTPLWEEWAEANGGAAREVLDIAYTVLGLK